MAQAAYREINGRKYLRVTALLKVLKDPEYPKDGDARVMREAASIGTKVHKLIETDIRGKPTAAAKVKITAEIDRCFEAYLRYKRECPFEVEATEQLVWSEDPPVCGTADLVSPDCVTDWKTSGRILWKHLLQVNAYAAMSGKATFRIVRLDKQLGDYETHNPLPTSRKMWEAVRQLYGLYELMYTGGRKWE